MGRPQRIGNDYVGVVVNIAARLCEAAPEEGVLISGAVRERIPDQWRTDPAADKRLRGVPEDVSLYCVIRGPDAPKTRAHSPESAPLGRAQ